MSQRRLMVLDNVGGTVNFFHLTSRPTIIDSQLVFAQKSPLYIFKPNSQFFISKIIYKIYIKFSGKMIRIFYILFYVGLTESSKCCSKMKINLYTVPDTPKSQFFITKEIYQGKILKINRINIIVI